MGAIQQTRYDELLRRTTGQYGGGSKVGEALEDLFPTIDVENVPIELLRATKWILGSAGLGRTPGAGLRARIALFNPVGSGQLVVLEKAYVVLSVAGQFDFGPIFTGLTTVSLQGAERDLREGAITPTVARIQHQDNAAASAFGLFQIPANNSFGIDVPKGIAVLAPGTGFQVAAFGVDVTMRCAFYWRERVALPEELNF